MRVCCNGSPTLSVSCHSYHDLLLLSASWWYLLTCVVVDQSSLDFSFQSIFHNSVMTFNVTDIIQASGLYLCYQLFSASVFLEPLNHFWIALLSRNEEITLYPTGITSQLIHYKIHQYEFKSNTIYNILFLSIWSSSNCYNNTFIPIVTLTHSVKQGYYLNLLEPRIFSFKKQLLRIGLV